jgi:ribonuclease E
MISANLEDQLGGIYATDYEENKDDATGKPSPEPDDDIDVDDDEADYETDEDNDQESDEEIEDEDLDDEKFRERLDTEFPLSGGETEEDL